MNNLVSGTGSGTSVSSVRQTGLSLINALGKPSTETLNAKTEPVQSASASVQLSVEAKATVARLQARDRQVRAHEQAHLAASGGLATSGASYSYQKGPDGISYAVGGEVTIEVSPGNTPQDTIARAIIIREAALAPADPSGPDRAIAAQASQMEQKARGELFAQQQQQQKQDKASKVAAAYANSGLALPARINSYA